MHILYDGSICLRSAPGGISRYFTNLINGLPQNFHPTLTTCQRLEMLHPGHQNLRKFHFQRYGFRPGRISYYLEKQFFRTINYLNNFDILHPTYYELLTRQEMDSCRFPIVLSVHDMIHEIFADQIDIYGLNAAAKCKAISAAQAIACVSENTRKDLLERYRISEERVFVTHLASEIDESMSYGSESVPQKPYVLYVGRRGTYKNFETLLIAFAKISERYKDLSLCLVGPPLDTDETKRIFELGISDRIEYFGHIDDHHLAKLYRCSLTFVYPSLYEGFGIPPLEAMSCGTPVIASNRSSIPEVVGQAGLLIEPKSIDALVDALIWIIEEPSKRSYLIAQGYERAKAFSWEKTVAQTLDIYQLVANQ